MKNGFFTLIPLHALFTRIFGFRITRLRFVLFTLACISVNSQAVGSGTALSVAEASKHVDLPVSDTAASRQCIKTAAQARRLLHTGNAILVDVRERTPMSTSIPDALAIPLYALESKSFLYGKNVVIVGSGLNDNELTNSCVELRQRGNGRVYVVKGGFPTWSRFAAESGVGVSIELAEKVITPRELYRLFAQRADIRVVEIGSDRLDVKGKSVFGNSVKLPIETGTDDDRLLSSLKTLIDEYSDDAGVVIVTSDGEGYMPIHKFLGSNGIYRDFYLQGGLKAYMSYVGTRRDFLKKKKMGPVERVGCGDV